MVAKRPLADDVANQNEEEEGPFEARLAIRNSLHNNYNKLPFNLSFQRTRYVREPVNGGSAPIILAPSLVSGTDKVAPFKTRENDPAPCVRWKLKSRNLFHALIPN